MVGDFRDVQQSKNVRDKIAQQVNAKWEESYNQGKQNLFLVLPPYDETISKNICPKYVKRINTERGLASLTKSSIVPSTDMPLLSTPGSGKKYSETAYQKSQRAMKGANDIAVNSSPNKVTRFDDSLQNLTETNRKLEQLMHKPKTQWTAEDKKLIALTKTLK